MIILLVEDDLNKARNLAEFIRTTAPGAELREVRSYHAALRVLVSTSVDVVLLDMSLPTYDEGSGSRGARVRHFGGRDLLFELQRRAIRVPVVVVTQFETFGEGKDLKTRRELEDELQRRFRDNFQGMIYYSPSESVWRSEIQAAIRRAGSK